MVTFLVPGLGTVEVRKHIDNIDPVIFYEIVDGPHAGVRVTFRWVTPYATWDDTKPHWHYDGATRQKGRWRARVELDDHHVRQLADRIGSPVL